MLASSSVFCTRSTWLDCSRTNCLRVRSRLRISCVWVSGTKLARIRPCANSSASHIEEVVDADNDRSVGKQALAEMRTEKASAAGYEHAFFEMHNFPNLSTISSLNVERHCVVPLLFTKN